MKRLRLFIVIFSVAISLPLAYVIWHTYGGLEQEERAQLRFFSETMFDQMEKELADLVQREENRTVYEYGHTLVPAGVSRETGMQLSPLAQPVIHDYILGYLQNNPDGSFQTPLVADLGDVPQDKRTLVLRLKEANRLFNLKKFSISQLAPAPAPSSKAIIPVEKKEKKSSFSERYLTRSKKAPTGSYLGKKQQRVEEITAEQALNIASEQGTLQYNTQDVKKIQAPAASARKSRLVKEADDTDQQYDSAVKATVKATVLGKQPQEEVNRQEMMPAATAGSVSRQDRFQVEVAQFQSVSLKDDQVYIFRRIAINNRIYRQGFILLVQPLLRHLVASHFSRQPLASFTALEMGRRDQGQKINSVQAGRNVVNADFFTERIFPAPFDFLGVSLKSKAVPVSPARRSLTIAMVLLAVFMSLGLLVIYQSVRTIVAMSERRSQFVSSVTHELKTPLTNIRMYIEMLEQGIADSPEREQEYLGILGSESTRLSGLINNVLELARLEKKQRHFHMQMGQLDDVLTEVGTVMSQKLKQDGFTLAVNVHEIPRFAYDRDVLIQVLMNLIENSVKFGKYAATRRITIKVDTQDRWVRINVSDTGPGIPRRALIKIFDDFYRVDNDLTRITGGTGIGLALVKKFVTAMGGRVEANNNTGSGCTITLLLPVSTG